MVRVEGAPKPTQAPAGPGPTADAARLRALLVARRDELGALAARHGMADVRVFGSVARGDAGPGSDVDLVVSPEPGRSLFDLANFAAEAEELLGVPVDVVSARGVKPRARRILEEARPL